MSSTFPRDRPPRDTEAETFQTTYLETARPPSHAVVRAVAAVVGQRPDRLLTTLADVVDPDALDALFGGASGDGDTVDAEATFILLDCLVTVHGDGRITIRFPVG